MLLSLCFLGVTVFSPQEDLSFLTKGVTKVARPGLPGVVSAISPTAVPFLTGQDGRNLVPVASGGRLGKGKVVAFGHGGYLSLDSQREGDTGRLLANVLQWTSSRTGKPRVGYLNREDRQWIEGLGYATHPLHRDSLAMDLRSVDVAVLPASFDSPAVENYVANGGGLVTAHTPWGWMQLNPGKDLATQMPMQRLLHRAGLSFSDGTAEVVRPTLELKESESLNASLALENLDRDGRQAASVIMAALRSTTPQVPFNADVRKRVSLVNAKIPSKASPLTGADGIARLALTIGHLDLESGRAKITPDPGAKDFPGAVASNEPRVEAKVEVPLDTRQWVSTGYYAAPGETVEVEVPLVLTGVNVQIGCHSDSLWHLEKWERHPDIMVRKPLAPPTTKITSPFGGLIYIVVDRPYQNPPLKLTLSNVIRSARYVHGQTTPEQWQNQLKSNAPWAEIGSDRVIFSVPIEDARKVTDPVALMNLWDRSLGLYQELDGRPLPDRPERIVCDRQISAGYMHSGYPIMTWMDKSIELSLSVDQLTTQGTWGHWHELGHNHQKGEWTFSGTGEVTCNLYSLFLMEKIAKRGIWDRIGSERQKVQAYLAKGGDFAQWQREPFLALTLYAQLIEGFGWDSMKKYLRSYEGPDAGPMPKNDLEKRDQFMTRYSKVVGRNLAPFFQRWGIPTSAEARDSIRNLPSWTPRDFPKS